MRISEDNFWTALVSCLYRCFLDISLLHSSSSQPSAIKRTLGQKHFIRLKNPEVTWNIHKISISIKITLIHFKFKNYLQNINCGCFPTKHSVIQCSLVWERVSMCLTLVDIVLNDVLLECTLYCINKNKMIKLCAVTLQVIVIIIYKKVLYY